MGDAFRTHCGSCCACSTALGSCEGVQVKLDNSMKSFHFFAKWMGSDCEELWVAALDSQLKVLEKKMIFRGTVDACLFHPRDVIRFLCLQNASSFVMAHNHPSGSLKPSKEDVRLTKKMYQLSKLLEIPMRDHLIICREKYFSFADSEALYRMELLSLSRAR